MNIFVNHFPRECIWKMFIFFYFIYIYFAVVGLLKLHYKLFGGAATTLRLQSIKQISAHAQFFRIYGGSLTLWSLLLLLQLLLVVLVCLSSQHHQQQQQMQSTWPSSINIIMLCAGLRFACQANWGLFFHIMNTFLFFVCILQVLGTIIFGVGLWLAIDKHSLIALLKLVESERIEVSVHI